MSVTPRRVYEAVPRVQNDVRVSIPTKDMASRSMLPNLRRCELAAAGEGSDELPTDDERDSYRNGKEYQHNGQFFAQRVTGVRDADPHVERSCCEPERNEAVSCPRRRIRVVLGKQTTVEEKPGEE